MKNKIHPGYDVELEIVLPKLVNYTDDITKHDKEMLKGYAGEFILGYRENGTNLYRLNSLMDSCDWCTENHFISIDKTHEWSKSFLLTNKYFLFFDEDGNYEEISVDRAIEFLEVRREKAIKVACFFQDINLQQIVFDLRMFIFRNGKHWKKRLQEEWNENSCSSNLKQLKNYFGSDILQKSLILINDNENKIYTKLVMLYIENQ